MEYIVPFLSMLLLQLPVYLVWLAGIIIAAITWRKHPGVSVLAIVGLMILLLNSLLGSAFNLLLPYLMRENRIGISEIGTISIIRSLTQDFISGVAWALILWAIFGWRARSTGQKLIPGS